MSDWDKPHTTTDLKISRASADGLFTDALHGLSDIDRDEALIRWARGATLQAGTLAVMGAISEIDSDLYGEKPGLPEGYHELRSDARKQIWEYALGLLGDDPEAVSVDDSRLYLSGPDEVPRKSLRINGRESLVIGIQGIVSPRDYQAAIASMQLPELYRQWCATETAQHSFARLVGAEKLPEAKVEASIWGHMTSAGRLPKEYITNALFSMMVDEPIGTVYPDWPEVTLNRAKAPFKDMQLSRIMRGLGPATRSAWNKNILSPDTTPLFGVRIWHRDEKRDVWSQEAVIANPKYPILQDLDPVFMGYGSVIDLAAAAVRKVRRGDVTGSVVETVRTAVNAGEKLTWLRGLGNLDGYVDFSGKVAQRVQNHPHVKGQSDDLVRVAIRTMIDEQRKNYAVFNALAQLRGETI